MKRFSLLNVYTTSTVCLSDLKPELYSSVKIDMGAYPGSQTANDIYSLTGIITMNNFSLNW